jgi:hypothetical protein
MLNNCINWGDQKRFRPPFLGMDASERALNWLFYGQETRPPGLPPRRIDPNAPTDFLSVLWGTVESGEAIDNAMGLFAYIYDTGRTGRGLWGNYGLSQEQAAQFSIYGNTNAVMDGYNIVGPAWRLATEYAILRRVAPANFQTLINGVYLAQAGLHLQQDWAPLWLRDVGFGLELTGLFVANAGISQLLAAPFGALTVLFGPAITYSVTGGILLYQVTGLALNWQGNRDDLRQLAGLMGGVFGGWRAGPQFRQGRRWMMRNIDRFLPFRPVRPLPPLNPGRVPTCFPPDTLVGTETGLRPISTVYEGDRVWGFDFVAGQWRLAEVERRNDAAYAGPMVTLDVGLGEVTATAMHPFWIVRGEDLENRPKPGHSEIGEDRGLTLEGRWVNSNDIRVGDEVYLRGCGVARVQRVMQRDDCAYVCNLTVNGLHTFAVGKAQMLVHNTGVSEFTNRIRILQEELNVNPNNPARLTELQAVQQQLIGRITELRASLAGLNAEQAAPMNAELNGLLSLLRTVVPANPQPGTLTNTNYAARIWYRMQELSNPGRINRNLSLEQQARQAFELRNAARTGARDLMADRARAADLAANRPNWTWEQIVEHYRSRGFEGDALWNQIIAASTRMDPQVNVDVALPPDDILLALFGYLTE